MAEIKFSITNVYFLVSLSGNHFETAEDLYKYRIKDYFERSEMILIKSSNNLIQELNRIKNEIQDETAPLIHIECHGLDSGNGIELLNGEQIYWTALRDHFTEINRR